LRRRETIGYCAHAAEAAMPNDPEIEALNLNAIARAGAYALKAAHPQVKFTSGRRDERAQARAMAANVVRERKWIERTYKVSAARTACQAWVDAHPEATTPDAIAAGLLTVFDGLSKVQVSAISRHLSGDAFDVQPVTDDAEVIKARIRGLAGLDLFLDVEGGLVRWHAQFESF
jgi:hypothetical protein